MCINIEITRDELQALNKVIRYLWDDESKDYRTDPRPNHIFQSVETMRNLVGRAGD